MPSKKVGKGIITSIEYCCYERTMLTDKSVSSALTQIPQGIFKDPYIIEFLDLPDVHSETDFELALIKYRQKFIL